MPARAMISLFLSLTIVPAPTPVRAQGSTIEIQRDIAFSAPDGKPLSLDVFLPSGGGTHAGVLAIHGGAWREADRERMAPIATQLAEAGFVAFAVDYRPSTEAPFPAALHDLQAAVTWIRDHAEEFRVDPERIGAVGSSSGAHLAALLATRGEGPSTEGSRIAAAAAFSGPMDLVPLLHLTTEDTPKANEAAAAVEQFLGCGEDAECEARAEEASPITHVDETDPPLFMANGSEEIIPADQPTEMAAALHDVGVASQVVKVPGIFHGQRLIYLPRPFADGRTISEAYLAFLGRWLEEDVDTSIVIEASPQAPPRGGGPAGPRPGLLHDERAGREGDVPLALLLTSIAAALAALIAAAMFRRVRRPRGSVRRRSPEARTDASDVTRPMPATNDRDRGRDR